MKAILYHYIIRPLTPRWVKVKALDVLMENMVSYYRDIYIKMLTDNVWEGIEEEQELKETYYRIGLATPAMYIMQNWFDMSSEDVFDVIARWDDEVDANNNKEDA